MSLYNKVGLYMGLYYEVGLYCIWDCITKSAYIWNTVATVVDFTTQC